ncbi:hypothetical protein GCM10011579_086760 [Streptomyces albiflavescens]|uniref:Uncharacterized protein n=1 Tax=Streptomyces albiflavescens TaxID=1623582 RepID=A0A917YDM8_9ACTN|nr:hypothetical protein GCM10011579_086760 [Streptomyces albiflavescens]
MVRCAVALYVAVDGACPAMTRDSLPWRANVHPFSALMACRARATNWAAVLGFGADGGRDVLFGSGWACAVREDP